MKVIQVHNRARGGGGADECFDATIDLLIRNGIQASVFERSSKQLGARLRGKLTAFSAGIYSPLAIRDMNKILQEERPDIVHVHELYPFLPWALQACGNAGVPVVMTCHNFRLICPIYICFCQGLVCKKCCRKHEYWCIIKNCRGSLFESVAFALHSMVARKKRLFENNVTLFITPSEFLKGQLVQASYKEEQIAVLPHMVPMTPSTIDYQRGQYIAYSGRICPEKGIETLISAASKLPHIRFHITGDNLYEAHNLTTIPNNITFVGWLNRVQLAEFYRNAQFLVIPSVWLEVFGLVAIEAMSYGLPIIASRIGGLKEIIDDGITGLLCEPGDTADLISKIQLLWDNPDLCHHLGTAAQRKARQCYSEETHYKHLIAYYEKAIEMKRTGKIF